MTITSKILAALRPKPQVTHYRMPNGRVWLSVYCNAAAAEEPAEMVIDGTIGESWYDSSGTTSKAFRYALSSIPKNKRINLKLNSDGGSVGDALSIHDQIGERGNIHCRVEGYALSSASIIAIAGDRCVMPRSSIMMIHDPWSITQGDEELHKKAVEMLATHGEAMAGIYARKTGMSPEECRALMKAECWMTGEEAVEEGFADEVDEDPESDTSARKKLGTLNLQAKLFARVTEPIMAKLTAQPQQQQQQQHEPSQAQAVIMNRTQMIALLKAWGVTIENEATITDADLIALVQKGKPIAAPVAAPTQQSSSSSQGDNVSRAEFEAMRQQMETQRQSRIESRIDALIGEQRLTNDERPAALTRALKDESFLEELGRRPVLFETSDPVRSGFGLEVTSENFMERVRAIRPNGGEGHRIGGLDAVAAAMRFAERRDNWQAMYAQTQAMDRRGKPGHARNNSNPLVSFIEARPLPGTDSGFTVPVAASTYSTSLIVDQLADGAITQLVNTLAPLRIFTRDFMASPIMPLATVQVRLVTQGGQLTKNVKPTGSVTSTTTDYEANADHAVTNVAVVMTEYSEAFMVTSGELMSGLRIEYLANHALETLGSNIISDTLTLLNTSSFSAGPSGGSITAHYGNWTWNSQSSSINDMAVLRSQLGKSAIKNAVLDPVLFSKLITIPVVPAVPLGVPLSNPNLMKNIFGWNEIAETTAWATGQGAGGSTASYPQPIIGFACHPQAIAAAARLPLLPPEGVPGNTVVMAQVTIPGLDMTIAIFQWFSPRYRTLFYSYGIVYGPVAGDLTAGCVVKSLGI